MNSNSTGRSIESTHNEEVTARSRMNRQFSLFSFDSVNPCLLTKSINSINHPVRLVTCDEPSSLSSSQQGNDRSLGKQSQKFSSGNYYSVQQQPVSRVTRQNTNSAGGDSGYSEENFGLIRHSSQFRSLHKSCPHCHCEQRSSLINNYSNKTNRQILNDSSTSDTTINIDDILTPDLSTRSNRDSRFLSTSRSYPHIKPLPKSKISANVETSSEEQVRRARTLTNRRRTRRRHLSCDSSLWTNVQTRKNNVLVKHFLSRSSLSSFSNCFLNCFLGFVGQSQQSVRSIFRETNNKHKKGRSFIGLVEPVEKFFTID